MKKTLLLFITLLTITITNAQLVAGDVFNDGLLDYTVTTLADPGSPNTVAVKGFTSGATIPTALIIPASVSTGGFDYAITATGINAFKNNTTITSLVVDGDTTIGSQSFANCTNLATVSLPNVTAIGVSATECLSFWKCTSLTSISFPKLVSIGTGAFNTCSSLTSITFPSTLTSLSEVNYNMFKGCTSLTSVTVEYSTLIPLTYNPDTTSVNPSIFNDVLANVTLTVPNGSLAAYQAADVWKDFSTITQAAPLSINSKDKTTFNAYPNPVKDRLYFSTRDVFSVEIYNLLGSKISSQIINEGVDMSNLSKGLYLVQCQDSEGVNVATVKVIKE